MTMLCNVKLNLKLHTSAINPLRPKATFLALIAVNEFNVFKKMGFEAIHSNRYISPYEWPIA